MAWTDSLYSNPDVLLRLAAALTPNPYRPAVAGLSGVARTALAPQRRADWMQAQQRIAEWEEARRRGLGGVTRPTAEEMALSRTPMPSSAFDTGVEAATDISSGLSDLRRENLARQKELMRASAQTQAPVLMPLFKAGPQQAVQGIDREQLMLLLSKLLAAQAMQRRERGTMGRDFETPADWRTT